MYPITGSHIYTPGDPCRCFSTPSDAVTLSGVIHVMTQVEPGLTGLVTIHANLIDVTGTGATGCVYHAVGAARLAANSPPVIPSRAATTSSHRPPVNTPRSRCMAKYNSTSMARRAH